MNHYTQYLLPNSEDIAGKTILLRVDWNATKHADGSYDTHRIEAPIPYIASLNARGARVIIITHFGENGESLKPLLPTILKYIPHLIFVEGSDPALSLTTAQNMTGSCILLENCRTFKGETENDVVLARLFASSCDIFINDAFSVSHRKHALTYGISTQRKSYLGPTCAHELNELTQARNGTPPLLVILGGAKISTKLPLISYFLQKGASVYVGGALAHNIWRARGVEIGTSPFDESISLDSALITHPLLFTPEDVIVSDGSPHPIREVDPAMCIKDIGKQSLQTLTRLIQQSQTIIWNGPLGHTEEGFKYGTEFLVTTLSNNTSDRYSGGGDTLSTLDDLHMFDSIGYVSLGGGAMLEYLAKGALSGLPFVTFYEVPGY